MLRVRYPDGTTVKYNDANDIVRRTDGIEIVRTKGEKQYWIAFVQASAQAIIEWVEPCKVENTLKDMRPENALRYVVAHLRDFDGLQERKFLKELKRELGKYSPRTESWRD